MKRRALRLRVGLASITGYLILVAVGFLSVFDFFDAQTSQTSTEIETTVRAFPSAVSFLELATKFTSPQNSFTKRTKWGEGSSNISRGSSGAVSGNGLRSMHAALLAEVSGAVDASQKIFPHHGKYERNGVTAPDKRSSDIEALRSLRQASSPNTAPKVGSHDRSITHLPLVLSDAETRYYNTTEVDSHGGGACASFSSDQLKSKWAMYQAGWKLRLDNLRFGMKSNEDFVMAYQEAGKKEPEHGKAELIFRSWGSFSIKITNSFDDAHIHTHAASSEIRLKFNGRHVKLLSSLEVCNLLVFFQPGDKLEMALERGHLKMSGIQIHSHRCSSVLDVHAIESFPVRCFLGQSVRLAQTRCTESGPSNVRVPAQRYKQHGRIKSILNQTHSYVQIGNFTLLAPFWDLVPEASAFSVYHLEFASRCTAFASDALRQRVGILVIGDYYYRAKHKNQIKSQACFAEQHGYELVRLNGDEYLACQAYTDFAFRRHCVVAEFLEQQSSTYIAVVLNVDVVAVVLSRSLKSWLDHGADVQLYEQTARPEISTNSYMVRNTPFSRSFLRHWALKSKIPRPRASLNADKVALHLLVMEAVKVSSVNCELNYTQIGVAKTTSAIIKKKYRQQYLNFVQCVRSNLGAPRSWFARINLLGNGRSHSDKAHGVVTIWPRLHFFVADGDHMKREASEKVGPVMHHGVKKSSDVAKYYYSSLTHCEVNRVDVLKTSSILGMRALAVVDSFKISFPNVRQADASSAAEGCFDCKDSCMFYFSCLPLNSSIANDNRSTRHIAIKVWHSARDMSNANSTKRLG